MRDIKRNAFVFLFIMFQTLLAVSCGLLALYYFTKDYIPQNVFIANIDVGGLEQKQASKKLEDTYDNVFKTGSIIINYGDNATFEIKYIDIDTKLDYTSTITLLSSAKKGEAFINLIDSYFNSKKREVAPVISINEGKLRSKLNDLASLINKEPVNANIYLKDNKVIKVAEITGIKLNLEKAISTIKAAVSTQIGQPIAFKQSSEDEINMLIPRVSSKDLEGVEEIISQYSTDIKAGADEDSIKLAVGSINKVLVFPIDKIKGEEAGVFSLNKYLAAENGLVEKNNEAYNQVASTLYAAALSAGIKPEGFVRTPHKIPVDYIEPGLDTVVFGKTTDFKFKNTLDNTLVVFAEIKDKKVFVYIVSKKKDSSVSRGFKFEIEQKYLPSVTYVESQDLKVGEKKLIVPGKEGMKIKLYLVTERDGIEVDKEYLYDDKYDAVESIVKIGPNTNWQENIKSDK